MYTSEGISYSRTPRQQRVSTDEANTYRIKRIHAKSNAHTCRDGRNSHQSRKRSVSSRETNTSPLRGYTQHTMHIHSKMKCMHLIERETPIYGTFRWYTPESITNIPSKSRRIHSICKLYTSRLECIYITLRTHTHKSVAIILSSWKRIHSMWKPYTQTQENPTDVSFQPPVYAQIDTNVCISRFERIHTKSHRNILSSCKNIHVIWKPYTQTHEKGRACIFSKPRGCMRRLGCIYITFRTHTHENRTNILSIYAHIHLMRKPYTSLIGCIYITDRTHTRESHRNIPSICTNIHAMWKPYTQTHEKG